jgi:hypothetical protein
MAPKPAMEIKDFLVKVLPLKVFLDDAHKHKEAQRNT